MRGNKGPSSDGELEPAELPDGDFFEGMVAAANDAVLTSDADGTIVYANDAVEDLLGYAPEELRGQQFVDFVPEHFRDRYDEWFDRYTDGEGGTPLDDETYEVTWRTADGNEKRLSVSGFVHESDDQTLFTGFVREAPEPDESGERLREEEALVEEIFDTSPIALAVRDADGELLRANDRAAELVGVGADQLPYDAEDGGETKEWSVYDADGDPLARDEYPVSHAFETGEPIYNEEVIVEKPSGKRLHLSVSAAPVRDGGEVERVVSTAENVTELKETQYELERRRDELETELAEVFSRIDDAFFALNDDWEFTYVNDEAEELLRHGEGELVGKSIWETFPETVDSAFQREYERAMETQEQTSFVEYYPPLSVWFEVRAYPSETGLSVYFRDVSDRIARERELERYETIVETVEDGIYVLDDDMEFSTVNSALAEMTGYAEDDLLGRRVWEFVADAGAVRDDVAERVEEMVAGERTSATIEIDVLTADGETFPAQVLFVSRKTGDGLEHVGVVRDVTEQKRRERELHDRVEQQRALSAFSRHALEDRELEALMDEAAELAAETLGQEFGKVLEFRPEKDDLLLQAGYGWDESVVGSATVGTERGSQAGYTLLSKEPVVVEDFPNEERFSYPDLKASRGMVSGVSTIVGSPDDPWGILETHATDHRSYADYEVQFVQSIAHILYTAIRRRERERELERYETIVETVEDGVYALDTDERFVMVNDAFCEMTGYGREELLGEHASVVHSDEVNEQAAAMSEGVAEEMGSATLELDMTTKDGRQIPVESRFGPYHYDEDGVARTGVVRDVTERKERERELEQVYAMVEAVEDGIYALDEESRFVTVNDAFVEMLGYEREEVVGQHASLVTDEENVAFGEQLVEEFTDGTLDVATVEEEMVAKDGRRIPVENRVTDFRIDEDRRGRVGVFRDISERLERQRELERHETIVETMEDGVFVLDEDYRFVEVNDTYCEMTGYDREELIGTHCSLVVGEEVADETAKYSRQLADGPNDFVTIEAPILRADGQKLPAESKFSVLPAEDGEFRGTVGVVRDVSERKRFEQTLTALHESSRELLGLETANAVAESVLQTVTDVLGIPSAGIYLYDDEKSELAPVAVSDRVEELFGVLSSFEPGDESITWRAFDEQKTLAFDDVRGTDLAYRDDTALKSGIWIPLGEHGVFAVVSEETGAFGPDEQELADLLAATTEAALDRVERERERREHERRLEEQNERLDAFASMLAHELRNPLEIAQIYLDMGVESATFEEDAGRSFREVEQALDRIEEMIETLLVVTRRSGDVDGTQVLDLGEVASEWWATLDDRDGTLDVLTDRKIRADPSRLRQLLENLYRNAEEHAGPDATVRVGDLPDGFYVADDGPGIPEETRDKVFEPGYSTSNVGIGFGLAVVRQLVEAHGWNCEITESPEGGARFEFTGVDVVEE